MGVEKSSASNVIAINAIDTASMDIETALLAVQSKRAELLETQLRDQIAAVQVKNELISKLNNALSGLTSVLSAYGSATDGAYDAKKAPSGFSADALNKSITDAGITDIGWTSTQATYDNTVITKDGGCVLGGASVTVSKCSWTDSLKRSDIDAAITKVKGNIDSLGNSQQMDTLRLQSLSAKRNEAFEQMTNWIKKMQDVRNSIIGNMR